MSFHGGESFAPLAVHVLYPPLSLPCQRKSAVHRGERNRFLPQILALKGVGLLMCGSCWSELLTGSGSLLPDALHSFPRERLPRIWWLWCSLREVKDNLPFLPHCRCPVPRGGVSKGEWPLPRPFESLWGCGGESKRPHISLRGAGGNRRSAACGG